MKVGGFDLPDTLVANGFDWFKKYYDQVLKGNVTETAEEAFVLLGGKLPEKQKAEKPAK